MQIVKKHYHSILFYEHMVSRQFVNLMAEEGTIDCCCEKLKVNCLVKFFPSGRHNIGFMLGISNKTCPIFLMEMIINRNIRSNWRRLFELTIL